jgi:hypothetical protein
MMLLTRAAVDSVSYTDAMRCCTCTPMQAQYNEKDSWQSAAARYAASAPGLLSSVFCQCRTQPLAVIENECTDQFIILPCVLLRHRFVPRNERVLHMTNMYCTCVSMSCRRSTRRRNVS